MKSLLTLALLLTLLPGCYCWDASHAADKACAAARVTVDCTKGSALEQAPALLPLVKWVLSGAPGGQMDWQSLLKSLMTFGFEVVGCTANQLDATMVAKLAAHDSATSSGAVPMSAAEVQEAGAVHHNWQAYVTTHFPNVEFKMPAAKAAK